MSRDTFESRVGYCCMSIRRVIRVILPWLASVIWLAIVVGFALLIARWPYAALAAVGVGILAFIRYTFFEHL